MLKYSYEQLAIVISIPVVTILLVWTTAIFHKNRKKWGPYDIPIVSILVLSIIRNLTILSYILVIALNQNIFNLEYCSILIWIFNSAHTFQASNLSTLAVIGLFSIKLNRKCQNIKQYLTSTHIIYHLFCVTTLCACVGVAAILAKNDRDNSFENVTVFEMSPCKLMPFDLDIKFNVFILVLHVFLASVSFICFVLICFNLYKFKRRSFDYLKKSNSDLSDFSNNNTMGNEKNYYDTYTIHRGGTPVDRNFYINGMQNQNVYCQNRDAVWSSDVSNMSTTVSSTNSRRPCLSKQASGEKECRTGLETINPILIVCYLIYHIPLIVLCIHPRLISPWPVSGAALWLGLLQDLLIPIGLGLVDSRFSSWVSNVYKCSRRGGDEKLPHVGLDGKFRPFGSQPQSLEIAQMGQDRNMKGLQSIEHRFPITNGSLFTSIDGRLPVIHNYRRHKDSRGGIRHDGSSSNLALNASHVQTQDYQDHFNCQNCEADLCPSHSNLHHLSPIYVHQKLNGLQKNNILLQRNLRPTVSHESLCNVEESHPAHSTPINNPVMKNSRNLLRLNRIRLSKSEDSLNEIQRELTSLKQHAIPDVKKRINKHVNEQILDYSSSDDDFGAEIVVNNFDSLSSKSSCSITTEANGDFHFYQTSQLTPNIEDKLLSTSSNKPFQHVAADKLLPPRLNKSFENLNANGDHSIVNHFTVSDKDLQNFDLPSPKNVNRIFKISRSNSKRSLENFRAFLEDRVDPDSKLQRSNSYMTLEDRKKKCNKKLLRSNSKLSDCCGHNVPQQQQQHKIKSVEYLPETNANNVWIEELRHLRPLKYGVGANCPVVKTTNHVGSVPDLKKVFISEYI